MKNRAITAAAAALALLSAASCTVEPTQPVAADSIHVAWRTPWSTASGTPAYHHIAADGERLYILSRGVVAFDLATGAQVWQAPATGLGTTSVVVRGGRVFTSSDLVRALNALNGTELWRFTPDTVATAVAAVDERAYYIGTDSRRVYALDVATGQPLWWSEVLPRGAHHSEVTGIVASGDTLYASLVEETSPTGHLKRGWIVAVDRRDGRVLWRYANERQGEPHDAGRHAVAGRMLLVSDLNGGAFFALDRFTGNEVWRHVGPSDRYGARDVFKVVDGVAYLASNDTRFYAFDPQTGAIRWTWDIKASASSSAVCGDYAFAAAGSLHMIGRSDGKEKAALFLDREGFVQPDAFVVSRLLAHGSRVYFVGRNAVYAVECSL
jgi:outer membrane protein assembly factor BamB